MTDFSITEYRKQKAKSTARFAFHCHAMEVPGMVQEFKFHPKRKWRFDYALPDKKLAFEYEGVMAVKSRHTTPTGMTGDCDKYNQAQYLGWKVYRFTVLNYQTLKYYIT